MIPLSRISTLVLFFFLLISSPTISKNLNNLSQTPYCRLDSSLRRPVTRAILDTVEVYKKRGISLPFETIEINSEKPTASSVLRVEIVKDATRDKVDSNGCLVNDRNQFGKEVLDDFSVEGGCYISQDSPNLLRCSQGTLRAIIGDSLNNPVASPGLLYVIAHELAHLHQNAPRAFIGKSKTITLSDSKESKLNQIIMACNPSDESIGIEMEEEADVLALIVLKEKLGVDPYKEPFFSPRGSMYWNIDKIRLAADKVQKWVAKTSVEYSGIVHPLFDPDSKLTLPASEGYVKWAANKFICDVLTESKGKIIYPLRQSTHPAPELRMMKVAEALENEALKLDSQGGSRDYERALGVKPLAQLQENLGSIFTFMDKEYGKYFQALHREICTISRADDPLPDCKKVPQSPPQEGSICDSFEGTFIPVPIKPNRISIGIKVSERLIEVDGKVRAAIPLENGDMLLGLDEPECSAYWNAQTRQVEAYELPGSPVSGVRIGTKKYFLCKSPFGVITINEKNIPTEMLSFSKGISGGESLEDRMIIPRWIGELDGRLIISISFLSGSGTDIALDVNTGRTVKAWSDDPKCSRLITGMELWKFSPDGDVYGFPVGTKASRHIARFNGGLDKIIDVKEAEYIGCGPSYLHNAVICADRSGNLFPPADPRQQRRIGRFSPLEFMNDVRIFGAENSLYILAMTEDGNGGSAFYALEKGKSVAQLIYKSDTSSGGNLSCSGGKCVAIVNRINDSVIISGP